MATWMVVGGATKSGVVVGSSVLSRLTNSSKKII